MKILVVEDEEKAAAALRQGLGESGFEVDHAPDGEEGLRMAREHAYDAVVLDIMLPKRDGWSVLTELRKEGRGTPILVLTARDEVPDRVKGFELGADDYLVKPFGRAELLARIAAVMRRAERSPVPSGSVPDGDPSATTLQAGTLVLDLGRHEAHVGGAQLDLTPIEYRLAEALVRAHGDLVPHLRLVRAGWPAEADPDLLWLKPHVARLRRKVEAAGGPAIHAVRGVGYRLDVA